MALVVPRVLPGHISTGAEEWPLPLGNVPAFHPPPGPTHSFTSPARLQDGPASAGLLTIQIFTSGVAMVMLAKRGAGDQEL